MKQKNIKKPQQEKQVQTKKLNHSPIALGFSALAAMTIMSACSVKRAPNSADYIAKYTCKQQIALQANLVQANRMANAEGNLVQTAVQLDENNLVAERGIKVFNRQTVVENQASEYQISFNVPDNCESGNAVVMSPTLEGGQELMKIKMANVEDWTFTSTKNGITRTIKIELARQGHETDFPETKDGKKEIKKEKQNRNVNIQNVKTQMAASMNTLRLIEVHQDANGQGPALTTLVVSQVLPIDIADQAQYPMSSAVLSGAGLQSVNAKLADDEIIIMTAAELLGKKVDADSKKEEIKIDLQTQPLQVEIDMAELNKQIQESLKEIQVPTLEEVTAQEEADKTAETAQSTDESAVTNDKEIESEALTENLEESSKKTQEVLATDATETSEATDKSEATEDSNVIVVTGKRMTDAEKAAYDAGVKDAKEDAAKAKLAAAEAKKTTKSTAAAKAATVEAKKTAKAQ